MLLKVKCSRMKCVHHDGSCTHPSAMLKFNRSGTSSIAGTSKRVTGAGVSQGSAAEIQYPEKHRAHHGHHQRVVTKRRSSWACIGNPKPEQETIKGTHAQETSAYQRRPTTQHAAQGRNPPIRALYMQLAQIPHTHQTTPRATSAASAGQHGTNHGRNRYHPSAHTTKDEAPGQLHHQPGCGLCVCIRHLGHT